ncbi:MAG: hypothetical protein V4612_04825 [Pseudomonadota bacterium]
MLKEILKIILIILISQIINSCKPRLDSKAPSKFYQQDLENASPDFKQGWQDGCETGMTSGSNSFYQSFYKGNKQDGYKFAYSSDYKTAWGNAFWFCYRADWVDQRSTIFKSFFGGII